MRVGVLRIEFKITGARSLKDKRRVVKSLKEQLRNRYNCSVAETDFHDLWGRAQIGVCVISDEGGHVLEQLNEILRFSLNKPGVEALDHGIEMVL